MWLLSLLCSVPRLHLQVGKEKLLVTYIILPAKWSDFRMAPHGKLFFFFFSP